MCKGVTSSPAPCKTKTEKTMDKKFYFEPESEVIELNMMGTILVGSAGEGEGDPVPSGGGEGEETPGGWG